jgi:hypothetical protein
VIAWLAKEVSWKDLGVRAVLPLALLLAWDLRASAEDVTKMVRIGVLAAAETRPIEL